MINRIGHVKLRDVVKEMRDIGFDVAVVDIDLIRRALAIRNKYVLREIPPDPVSLNKEYAIFRRWDIVNQESGLADRIEEYVDEQLGFDDDDDEDDDD